MLNKMRFCSNLSFMFTEYPLLQRYSEAQKAGFKAVESGFPFGFSIEEVVKAKEKANVEQVLINIFTGDVTKGELGHAAIPGKEKEFKDALEMTISYAKALNCKKIHIMSGKVENRTNENYVTYENNLRIAEKRLKDENIVGLIEPINKYSVPNYFMNSFDTGFEIIKKINSPNLRLMIDIFHLQQISGNITRNITEFLPYSGHIQIAQVPNRNEPNTKGEIDYKYVLKFVENLGYDDWIGLEYKPETESVSGLTWVKEFGYSL